MELSAEYGSETREFVTSGEMRNFDDRYPRSHDGGCGCGGGGGGAGGRRRHRHHPNKHTELE